MLLVRVASNTERKVRAEKHFTKLVRFQTPPQKGKRIFSGALAKIGSFWFIRQKRKVAQKTSFFGCGGFTKSGAARIPLIPPALRLFALLSLHHHTTPSMSTVAAAPTPDRSLLHDLLQCRDDSCSECQRKRVHRINQFYGNWSVFVPRQPSLERPDTEPCKATMAKFAAPRGVGKIPVVRLSPTAEPKMCRLPNAGYIKGLPVERAPSIAAAKPRSLSRTRHHATVARFERPSVGPDVSRATRCANIDALLKAAAEEFVSGKHQRDEEPVDGKCMRGGKPRICDPASSAAAVATSASIAEKYHSLSANILPAGVPQSLLSRFRVHARELPPQTVPCEFELHK